LPWNYEELQTTINADGTSFSLPLVTTYAKRLPGRAVSLVGSWGLFEGTVVNGHAKIHLKAAVGDRVVVSWRN
jgi:S-adenosylmethionine hydrolase